MTNDSPKLITGGVFDWDMTSISDEQLQHEYDLAYEVLHDIHCPRPPWNGGVAIRGMLKEATEDNAHTRSTIFRHALEVWKLRLKRAEDELERRYLLS